MTRTSPAQYRAWDRASLSPIGRCGFAITAILVGAALGGCSVGRSGAFAQYEDREVTGSLPARPAVAAPSDADLAFARNAASDVLTKGTKDSSQPWENPQTGARGSVTPIASAYTSEGKTCRDFLASYVNGSAETWLQGAACQNGRGRWDIHTLKPWTRS